MGTRCSAHLLVAVVAIMSMAALPCMATDVAVLKNGFSIRHERREVVGNVTRLYVTADGSSYVDVPTAEIEHFEAAPDPAPAAASGSRLPASGTDSASSSRAWNSTDPPGGFPGRPHTDLADVVNEASGRYRLDPDLVNSVIKAESGFNVRAVSPKGAQGLMQLMPGTASQLGVPNVFDPRANVEGGTKYLRELLELYNFDLVKALAAYNAGPQRVAQFGGVPPYYETRAYVARVVKDFNKKKVAQKKAAGSPAQNAATAKSASAKASGVDKTHSSLAAPIKAKPPQPNE